MVDARYRNKKNGRVAVVVQEDQKYKTSLIQYEDDGSEQQVSNSTLKRWWEQLDDDDEEMDEVVDDQDDDEEYIDDDDEEYEDDEDGEEDTVEDDDEEEEAEEEVVEEEPAPRKSRGKKDTVKPANEVKKAVKKKAEPNPKVMEMLDYVISVVKEQGGEIYTPASQSGTRAFKVGGHMYARLLTTRSAVTVTCRAVVTDDIAEPTKKINHMFANLYTYESMNATDKKLVKKLLQASLKYQEEKNENSGKNKKAKAESKKGGKK